MLKIAVLISGGGTNLQAIIDSIENREIDGSLELVVSNRQAAYGLERARKHGINSVYLDRSKYETNQAYDQKLIELLRSKQVDLVVLAGYLRLLSQDFIGAFKDRIINIHPSLIPSFCGQGYYGEKVHQAVLDYGVKYTGATVHFVDEGTDTGPIISQAIVPVMAVDSPESLGARVLEMEHKLLVEAIKNFSQDRISLRGRQVIIK